MELTISDDFSLPKIAESGQCFRIRRFVDSTYRFITEGSILYIRELSQGLFEADCTVWRCLPMGALASRQ